MKRSECNGSNLMAAGFESLVKYGPDKMDLWFIGDRIREGAKVEIVKHEEDGYETLKIEYAGWMQSVAIRPIRNDK